jgi:hypothetical protein
MPIRTTEQSAPAQLAEYLTELSKLTTDQPTTSEIEEALRLVPLIAHVLKTWATSRHLGVAHSRQAAEFRERFPEVAKALEAGQGALRHIAALPVETPQEAKAPIHPVFAPLLAPLHPVRYA